MRLSNKNISSLILLLILGAVLLFFGLKGGWLWFLILFLCMTAGSVFLIIRTLNPRSDLAPVLWRKKEDDPPKHPAKFLIILFFISLAIRIAFTFMVDWNSKSAGGEGFFYKYVYSRGYDDQFYDKTGRAFARAWKQGRLMDVYSIFRYRGGVHVGYNMFVGLVYLVCGDNPLYAKLINSLLGALVIVYVFFIGYSLFGLNTARLASLICAVDSYQIFFTGFLYKDILVTLLTLFCIWQFIRYTRTGDRRALIYIGIGIFVEFFNRTYAGAALGMAMFAYFLVFAAPKDQMRRTIYFLILLILSSPFFYIFYKFAKSQLGSRVVRVRGEGGGSEDTGIEDERVYGVKRLAVNSLRIFFSPIPWRDLRETWENIFYWVYPGKIIWYVFLPFFFVGAYYCLRYRFRDSFVLAAVTAQYILILVVIMQTAWRHQLPIVPIMILTASAGFCKIKNPIVPYLVYLPMLAIFFSHDIDMLKEGAMILALLGVIFAGYLTYMFVKRRNVGTGERGNVGT